MTLGWRVGLMVAAVHITETVITLALGRWLPVPAWMLFSLGAPMGLVIAVWVGWIVGRRGG